jgi:hypothetical protein
MSGAKFGCDKLTTFSSIFVSSLIIGVPLFKNIFSQQQQEHRGLVPAAAVSSSPYRPFFAMGAASDISTRHCFTPISARFLVFISRIIVASNN